MWDSGKQNNSLSLPGFLPERIWPRNLLFWKWWELPTLLKQSLLFSISIISIWELQGKGSVRDIRYIKLRRMIDCFLQRRNKTDTTVYSQAIPFLIGTETNTISFIIKRVVALCSYILILWKQTTFWFTVLYLSSACNKFRLYIQFSYVFSSPFLHASDSSSHLSR